MNVQLRESAPHQRVMEVEVPAEEVQRGVEDAAREVQKRASLPGFRRGRAPIDLVLTRFAEVVEREFIEDFVPRAAQEAVAEAKLSPAVPPLVRNLQFQLGQPLRFEVQIDLRPEVEARDYKGIRVTLEKHAVEDRHVDQVLQGLLEDSAVYQDLSRPAERGDVLVLDSVRLDANGRRLPSTRGRNVRIQLGAPDVLPDLENGLLGAEAGHERTIAVSYPGDHASEELRGKTVRYLVRIKKIQEKKLRALDDNLAREVYRLDSLEELRARIRQNLEEEERQRARRELEGKISDALLQRNAVPVPERLVEYSLDHLLRELAQGRELDQATIEEMRERYRAGVTRSLQREILLDAIARHEKLSVSEEEVSAELDRLVAARPAEAARIRASYRSPERRAGLQERLLERKTLEWLAQSAQVEEEMVRDRPLVIPASG